MDNKIIINSIISKDYKSNTYVVLDDDFAIVFDTGVDVQDVKKVVGNRKVLGLFITHSHFDHIFNVNEYLNTFNCDLYISKSGYEKLYDNDKNLSNMFGISNFKVDKIDNKIILNDDENIVLNNFKIKVLETKGHSDCSLTYFVCDKWIISGDVLFKGGYGRYDFYDGNFKELFNSIKKIRKLGIKEIHPGHGEVFNLK